MSMNKDYNQNIKYTALQSKQTFFKTNSFNI